MALRVPQGGGDGGDVDDHYGNGNDGGGDDNVGGCGDHYHEMVMVMMAR